MFKKKKHSCANISSLFAYFTCVFNLTINEIIWKSLILITFTCFLKEYKSIKKLKIFEDYIKIIKNQQEMTDFYIFHFKKNDHDKKTDDLCQFQNNLEF